MGNIKSKDYDNTNHFNNRFACEVPSNFNQKGDELQRNLKIENFHLIDESPSEEYQNKKMQINHKIMGKYGIGNNERVFEIREQEMDDTPATNYLKDRGLVNL